MPEREALIVEAGGERFRLYYDRDLPEVLHITLQHEPHNHGTPHAPASKP